MSAMLLVPGALGAFAIALLIFGFAPGMVLALVVKMLATDDPRRRELQAELYAVPRWERPFWVCEQFEVALREGLFPEIAWYWGRLVWHRAKLESGIEANRRWPDSFWIPSADEKAELLPGDSVYLMWSVKRDPGERMWVEILERNGDEFLGRLMNLGVFACLAPGEIVKFHADHIIDYHLIEDAADGDRLNAAA